MPVYGTRIRIPCYKSSDPDVGLLQTLLERRILELAQGLSAQSEFDTKTFDPRHGKVEATEYIK